MYEKRNKECYVKKNEQNGNGNGNKKQFANDRAIHSFGCCRGHVNFFLLYH